MSKYEKINTAHSGWCVVSGNCEYARGLTEQQANDKIEALERFDAGNELLQRFTIELGRLKLIYNNSSDENIIRYALNLPLEPL